MPKDPMLRYRRPAPALAGATALLSLACGVIAPAPAEEPSGPLELATFPRTELQITHREANHAARRYPFRVWVADTPARAQQGLMFVRDLPETMGMVFPLQPPRVETMWMKNTYIELDLLFVGAGGRVTKIIERAHPLSLDTLSSDSPVTAVVELRGGEVAKLGLRVGDTVVWQQPAP
jgi:uncharacterized membrane protein (UPF0127 family)